VLAQVSKIRSRCERKTCQRQSVKEQPVFVRVCLSER